MPWRADISQTSVQGNSSISAGRRRIDSPDRAGHDRQAGARDSPDMIYPYGSHGFLWERHHLKSCGCCFNSSSVTTTTSLKFPMFRYPRTIGAGKKCGIRLEPCSRPYYSLSNYHSAIASSTPCSRTLCIVCCGLEHGRERRATRLVIHGSLLVSFGRRSAYYYAPWAR